MGMYTELKIKVELKKDIQPEIINWIKQCSEYDVNEDEVPDIMRGRLSELNGDSAYFDEEPYIYLTEDDEKYTLDLCTNIKNYENEIQTFLDFIDEWIVKENSSGHIWYEERDYENREILFKNN